MCVTADRIYILDKSVINTRTKDPLKAAIAEDFYYFFVYCGAIFTCIQCACRKVNLMYEEN